MQTLLFNHSYTYFFILIATNAENIGVKLFFNTNRLLFGWINMYSQEGIPAHVRYTWMYRIILCLLFTPVLYYDMYLMLYTMLAPWLFLWVVYCQDSSGTQKQYFNKY